MKLNKYLIYFKIIIQYINLGNIKNTKIAKKNKNKKKKLGRNKEKKDMKKKG